MFQRIANFARQARAKLTPAHAGTAFIVLASAGSAEAASFIPPAVSTSLGDLQSDVTTIGGLILLVVLAFAAFKVIRRAVGSA